jgi:hypothetical protein
MSALRKFAVCYLVSVSAFGLAAGLRAWPNAADQAARLFEDRVARPAAEALARADRAFLDAPDSNARVVMALKEPGPADGRTLAHAALPRIERPALIDDDEPRVQLTLDAPVLIAPDLPVMPAEPKPQAEARVAPARIAPKVAPKVAEAPHLPSASLTP